MTNTALASGADPLAHTIGKTVVCPIYDISGAREGRARLYVELTHIPYVGTPSVSDHVEEVGPESVLARYLAVLTGESDIDAYYDLFDEGSSIEEYSSMRDDWAAVTNVYLLDRYDVGNVSVITARIAPPTKSGIPVWSYSISEMGGNYRLVKTIRMSSIMYSAIGAHGRARDLGMCEGVGESGAGHKVTVWEEWYRGDSNRNPLNIFIDGEMKDDLLAPAAYASRPAYVLVYDYIRLIANGEYRDVLPLFHEYEAAELKSEIESGYVVEELDALRRAIRRNRGSEWRVVYQVDFGSALAVYVIPQGHLDGNDLLLVTLWRDYDGAVYVTHGVRFGKQWTIDRNIRSLILDSSAVKGSIMKWHAAAEK